MNKPKVFISTSNLWHTIDVDLIDHSQSDGITPCIHSLITREQRMNDAIQFSVRINPIEFVQLLPENDVGLLLALMAERIGRDKACSIINQHWNEIEEAQEEEEHGEY